MEVFKKAAAAWSGTKFSIRATSVIYSKGLVRLEN